MPGDYTMMNVIPVIPFVSQMINEMIFPLNGHINSHDSIVLIYA